MDLGVTAVMLPELDFDGQISLCASLGVRCYQYRPRIVAEAERRQPPSPWGSHRFDLTPQRLLREGAALTARLRRAGLEPWGTLPAASIDDPDDALRLHLEGAAVAQAGRVRIAPSPYPRTPFDYPAHLDRVVDRYSHIVERLARPLGVKVVIETHTGGLAASPALAWNLCRQFAPSDLGVILDLANFAREGAVAPTLGVSVLKDWIDCVHIGGSRRLDSGRDAFGCRVPDAEFCPLEDCDLPAPPWISALRDAGVHSPLIVEDFGSYADGPGRLARCVELLQKILGP